MNVTSDLDYDSVSDGTPAFLTPAYRTGSKTAGSIYAHTDPLSSNGAGLGRRALARSGNRSSLHPSHDTASAARPFGNGGGWPHPGERRFRRGDGRAARRAEMVFRQE